MKMIHQTAEKQNISMILYSNKNKSPSLFLRLGFVLSKFLKSWHFFSLTFLYKSV